MLATRMMQAAAAGAANRNATPTSPVNTVAPTISGTLPFVGDILTASSGTWTGTATITYTYQWQRGTSNIGGATSITYTVQQADVGSTLRVVVTASNGIAPNGTANSADLTLYSGGAMWSFGEDASGRLGLNTNNIDTSSPVQIGAGTNWNNQTGSYGTALALKSDGTIWTWGLANWGQLGDSVTTTPRSSPAQVGALTTWSLITSTSYTHAAIKTDGTIWTWGNGTATAQNDSGINRSSPIQVGALTNWAILPDIQGNGHMMAIKTDGTMWGWGDNGSGEVGANHINPISSPVQIGALTNWSSATTCANVTTAIKTDGTMWAWGINTTGECGLGDAVNRSSPVQIGALTNWLRIAGARYCTVAVKTNGTLWSWGANSQGALGQSDIANRSSPTQVGALTTWKRISGGGYSASAIKTDGTLWTWGRNTAGQLGINTAVNTSSPQQVGALTTWLRVSTGYFNTFGIK